MSEKRWLRFAYYSIQRTDRDLPLHQLRDADGALFLAPALAELGYAYGGLLLNYPLLPPSGPPDSPLAQAADMPLLGAQDLLVLTTRPPLHDWEQGNRSRIERSYSPLEEAIFRALRSYLQRCSRLQVVVSDDEARQSAFVAARHNVEFADTRTAPVQRIREFGKREWARPSEKSLTLAYSIYVPALWNDGPGLLTTFGLGGIQTLAWTYRLGRDLRHLLLAKPFVMAEMTQTNLPERATTMAFADDWLIRWS